MSRRRAAEKRKILPDPKYKDLVVAKFTNSLMLDGKKSVAESIIYGAFDLIEKKAGQDPLKTFLEAIENVKPGVEVRSRRVGGADEEARRRFYRPPARIDRFPAHIVDDLHELSGIQVEHRLRLRLIAGFGRIAGQAKNIGDPERRGAEDIGFQC